MTYPVVKTRGKRVSRFLVGVEQLAVPYGMVGTVVECSTAALRVVDLIPALNKYLFDLQVFRAWFFVNLSSNVYKPHPRYGNNS